MSIDLFPLTEAGNGGWDARVRVFHAGDEVDVFTVTTDRHLVLVDTTTTPEQARKIVGLVAADLAGRSLLVVNTHADYDHAWGNCAFTEPIIGHRRTAEILRDPETARQLERRRAADPRFAGITLSPPSITFEGALTIDGGDLTIELFEAIGHTRDQIALWIPEIRLLLAADAAEHPFPHVADSAGLFFVRETLTKLNALDPRTVLACHGGTSDPGLPTRNLAYFDEVERHCRRALESGSTQERLRAADDPGAAIGFGYDAALRFAGTDPTLVDPFYRDFHRDALLATLDHLAGVTSAPGH
ncbi:MAG: MBL fold metallo-hydrolase [Thermomicrobiales bacterium]